MGMWAVKLCCNKICQILIGVGLLTQIDLFNGHKMVVYMLIPLFSERELMFAICCRPSVCRVSVGNARAPFSGGSNFRQYFYGIRYLGHLFTSTENFTEIVPGEPLCRES